MEILTDNLPAKRATNVIVHSGFIVAGVVTVILGPILPILIARWSMTDERAGLFFTLQFCGNRLGDHISRTSDFMARLWADARSWFHIHGAGNCGLESWRRDPLPRGHGWVRLRSWSGSLSNQFVGVRDCGRATSAGAHNFELDLGHWRDYLSGAGDAGSKRSLAGTITPQRRGLVTYPRFGAGVYRH